MANASAAASFGFDSLFEARPGDVACAPTRAQVLADKVFRGICLTCACLTVCLVTFIVLRIALSAAPAMQRYGFDFLTGRVWDPNAERYGILAEIWGTVYTSLLALALGTAFGLAVAIFLSEGYLGEVILALLQRANLHTQPAWARFPDRLEHVLRNLIELLAAIPSVVY